MIKLEDRIRAWATVGKIIKNLNPGERSAIILGAQSENAWSTEENIERALQRIVNHLDEAKLRQWTRHLPELPADNHTIGIVAGGNIPLAGFHDILAVLISGYTALVKLNPKDAFLPKYIANILCEMEPRFQQYIGFAERLNDVDAIIATGKGNSPYFEQYFAKIPHIIRKSRTGCAIINGEEPPEELIMLGNDIFSYFGLGDRNVSKLYVPEDYNFMQLLDAFTSFRHVLHHHRYNNHYDYNKSIYLVNREPHYDTGFLLLRESQELFSPISVVHYEYYKSQEALNQKISSVQDKLQCIVSWRGWYPDSLAFGQSQQPEWDDADKIDTLAFIRSL